MDMNIDVKDLFAKLKNNKKSGGDKKKRTGSGLTGFFEKNPKMKIILPIILIAISVLVALVIIFTTQKTTVQDVPADAPANQEEVQVLPQEIIEHESFAEGGGDAFDDVDVANAKVTAIIPNSDGYYTAVIETDKQSFTTLQVGDHINGSSWIVENITDDMVIISCDGKKVELKLGSK